VSLNKMTNKQYVVEFAMSKKVSIKMLEAMLKYGENHWWLSKDLETIGYHQLKEEALLVKFEIFHKGVEQLLQRTLTYYDLLANIEDLKKEAEKVWNSKCLQW
jgi:hypothetical protein